MAVSEIIVNPNGGGVLNPTLLTSGSVTHGQTATVNAPKNKRYVVTASANYTNSADQSRGQAYIEDGTATSLSTGTNLTITYDTANEQIKLTNSASSTDVSYAVIQLD